MDHHAQVLARARTEVRHRRRGMRTGAIHRCARQERQRDIHTGAFSTWRSRRVSIEMKSGYFKASVLVCGLAAAGASWPVWAHHSFAVYDRTKVLTLKGEV